GRIADRIKGRVWQCYEAAVLGRPGVVLAALFALVAALASQAGDFRLDASADSLLLENDDDLRYYRSLVRRYGSDDFVAVTVTPGGDLFAPPALARLDALQNDLAALPGIRQVLSLLDVPLLDSPRISLSDLSKEKRTLRTPGVDTEMARREFQHSPLYRNLLLSDDGGTTMMLAYLETDDTLENLLAERERLRLLKQQRGLDAEQTRQLAETSRLFRARQAEQVQQRRATIAAVRGVMDHHRERAELSLGGVPMIIADMIAMIENDLVVFGAAVAAFLVLMLTVIFRSPRWVALPMMCCLLSALAMVGLLGLLDWRVTVISSNFVALILIIAMSMTIHLTVRFRELQAARPAEEPRQLLKETVRFMFRPCIYTSLTTIVAFVSLLASGIRPVIDFGWLMTLGIVFAFFLIFTLFPSFLMVLKKGESRAENDFTTRLTGALARLTRRRHRAIAVVGLAAALASAFGIGQLEVENRFIDYFRDDTEIHRGMLLIDRKLGGTTPLDIVLKA
ncbi:MAG: MMPL family transporter, partial [Gammaproteobacteria bacterium]|nr:MMPL family transporter [Gammaproteobacteria bacterium]